MASKSRAKMRKASVAKRAVIGEGAPAAVEATRSGKRVES